MRRRKYISDALSVRSQPRRRAGRRSMIFLERTELVPMDQPAGFVLQHIQV
jgi:hypothetical protein